MTSGDDEKDRKGIFKSKKSAFFSFALLFAALLIIDFIFRLSFFIFIAGMIGFYTSQLLSLVGIPIVVFGACKYAFKKTDEEAKVYALHSLALFMAYKLFYFLTSTAFAVTEDAYFAFLMGIIAAAIVIVIYLIANFFLRARAAKLVSILFIICLFIVTMKAANYDVMRPIVNAIFIKQ
jgi:hypothetical protein